MEKELEHVVRCPRCFGRDVRHSQHRGFLDAIMQWLHRAPYRCRNCKNRFYVYVAPERDEVDETIEAAETEPETVEPKNEPARNPDVR